MGARINQTDPRASGGEGGRRYPAGQAGHPHSLALSLNVGLVGGLGGVGWDIDRLSAQTLGLFLESSLNIRDVHTEHILRRGCALLVCCPHG